MFIRFFKSSCSNNTNKLSPQERQVTIAKDSDGSNNTNKLSPQELSLLPASQG